MSEEEEQKEAVIRFSSQLLDLLKRVGRIELEDVDLEIGDLEIRLTPTAGGVPVIQIPEVMPAKEKPTQLLEVEFPAPASDYIGKIVEVTLGATKKEGGTRGKTVTIGGETLPSFYFPQHIMPHPPVIAFDVFDMKIPLAKAVKTHVKDVMEDPVAWSKLCVDKFGADVINLHLVSIDPLIQDTPPKEAAKTVEDVLQAVDVPLAVGGCGDPKKDLAVFDKVGEVAEGERILINSVTLDMDAEESADVVKKHGHAVIAFTPMDVNRARELNRKLYEYLPREDIVIDTTTAALGYGLEYAFTVMERTRLAALRGDEVLQHPISSGTTNAWAAREAWMKLGPDWGPRELRGPMWETVTALTLLLAGVDYFMMMHPTAAKTTKEVIEKLSSEREVEKGDISDWVTMSIG